MPAWLSSRMAKLGRLIIETLVLESGRDEVLRRLAHPFWFQSFGAVMGMDWHSSGITTSVIGALKRGLAPVADELGIHICGGRGRHSRKTPQELVAVAERVGLDGDGLARSSRLVAKVDSATVQDGFQLYLHAFIVTDEGRWVVVQQGMNDATGMARRYHWLSESVRSFVETPHAAIEGQRHVTPIVNLTDVRAGDSRTAQLELVQAGPQKVIEVLKRVQTGAIKRPTKPGPILDAADGGALPHCQLPRHHEVRPTDVFIRRLWGTLAAAADRGPKDFEELLLTPGVGARTVESLALVSEIIYGAPCRFSDPGRFSYAHGGKDGHPFPVPLAVYDKTISTLRRAVQGASLGQKDRLHAVRQLDTQARILERAATGDDWTSLVIRERQRSPNYRGMTVFGPAQVPPPREQAPGRSISSPSTSTTTGKAQLAFAL